MLDVLGQYDERRALLSAMLRDWLGPSATITEVTAGLRRHVPGRRCILDVDMVVSHAGVRSHQALIAKIHAQNETAVIFRAMRELWTDGFKDPPLTIAEPIACDPRLHLHIVRRLSGDSLRARLAADAPVESAIEGAARWLAKLHTCSFRTGRRYTFERQLHTLHIWQSRVATVWPEAATEYGLLLRAIETRGRTVRVGGPATTHRDFSPDHIVVAPEQTAGLDFDELCQYDPLFDVAHFRVHLGILGLLQAGDLNRFAHHADYFLWAYERYASEVVPARLSLYGAVTCLKLVHILATVTRPLEWQTHAAQLLVECARYLR